MPFKDPLAKRKNRREYARHKYHTDEVFKAKHIERVVKNNEIARATVATMIAEAKKDGCLLCPETERVALALHHTDPKLKGFTIGNARRIGAGPSKVAEEIKKCVCLCHNCHAKVHAGILSLSAKVAGLSHKEHR